MFTQSQWHQNRIILFIFTEFDANPVDLNNWCCPWFKRVSYEFGNRHYVKHLIIEQAMRYSYFKVIFTVVQDKYAPTFLSNRL